MEVIPINDIKGFRTGQEQNSEAATGCTVTICENGAVCGVDVRGGSPGTRDTDALNPVNNREKVHAVLLSGGSSFGLDATGGVMKFLEQHTIGRDVGVTVVPNVCAAILFDLKCGSSTIRPDEQMGYAACENAFAGQQWQSGNYGAGAGATVGNIYGNGRAMKGGIGSFALRHGELYAGAVVAVNCIGDIYDNRIGEKIAGARSPDGADFADSESAILDRYRDNCDVFSGNTVIGCIITNARLTKAQATKLAALGHNGIARAGRPAHTIFDGDTIFAMCSGEITATLDATGILAAQAVEYAIVDAIYNAATFGGYIAAKDFGIKQPPPYSF
jgi:L-aminopeptidase/D-esterase-like protein